MRTTTMSETRVLIVDDHPFMRAGLAQTINDQQGLRVCGQASNATEALQMIETQQPQVAVVDISLGAESGIDLIERIHKQWPEMRILVSSMHDESLFAERALRAGALGFVNKSEPTDVFIAALQSVSAGEKYLSDRMTRRLRDQVRPVNPEPMLSPIQALSNRELEVFELIGRGQSTKQIAGKLGLSPKTVETYREHIKDKLNLANANELTCSAVQWVLEQCRLPAVEQNAAT